MICFVYLGLGREEMRVQRREERKIKINGDRLRVMRWVTSQMRVQRRQERKIKIITGQVRVIKWVSSMIFDWVSSEMREHREERRDEMKVQRGEETKLKKKKADQWVRAQSKKLIIDFNFITQLPSETTVYCLKSPPATFQNILFKHGFFSNNFQTTLF